jgi:membrane protease YdiL (CAAX protease family)
MQTDLSTSRLGCLLALTALPVVLTSAMLRVLAASHLGTLQQSLPSPYLDFAVYAVANWVTFALVVSIVSWERLRAYGLRVRLTTSRCLGAVVGFVVGLSIYMTVSALLPRFGLPPVRGMEFTAPAPLELLVMFASVVVTAAFCEEVFFRVVWIGALQRRIPTWAAVVVSIVAFAAIHYPYFGPGGVVFISVWALVPVSLFLWFGDCTAAMLMHMMNNAFAYLIVPLLFASGR